MFQAGASVPFGDETECSVPAVLSAIRPHATITVSRCGERFAIVDADALDFLWPFTWSLHFDGKLKHYARAQRCPETGSPIRLYMHHVIADAYGIRKPSPEHTHLDHKNGNGLDNRHRNLIWRLPLVNRWQTARWGT